MSKTVPELELRIINMSAQIRNLHDEVILLHSKKFTRFAEDECWIYQGHDDNLHSLTCPVVISATDLLAIKNKAEVNSLLVHLAKKR